MLIKTIKIRTVSVVMIIAAVAAAADAGMVGEAEVARHVVDTRQPHRSPHKKNRTVPSAWSTEL